MIPAVWKASSDRGRRSVNVGELERRVSAVGGGALTLYGLTRRSLPGLLLAIAGGGLLYRGATGHCATYAALGVNTAGESQGQSPVASVPHQGGVKVEKAVTVDKSPEELYRFWRDFENLPRFMDHLESVKALGDKRSHWVAKAPLGMSVAWDAEIINEVEDKLIAWRSLEGADIGNAGSVRFTPAPDGRGTEVKVTLEYDPPGGAIAAAFAKLLGEEPAQQVQEDLRRFKRVMEAGEIPTTAGQPSGRAGQRDQRGQVTRGGAASPPQALDVVQQSSRTTGSLDVVQQSSEESFPASDPPSWTRPATDKS